jgi:hypothetical protein
VNQTAALAQLARAAAAIPADAGADALWLKRALRRIVKGWPATSADAELGLDGRPSRAQLLVELAEFYDGDAWTKVQLMGSAARRYETDKWPRQRHLSEPRPQDRDKPDSVLFALHRCGERWPLKPRRLWDLLRDTLGEPLQN